MKRKSPHNFIKKNNAYYLIQLHPLAELKYSKVLNHVSSHTHTRTRTLLCKK